MENNKHPVTIWIQIILLIIIMIFLTGFTIYIQQPEPIEINQITFAGREIIKNNNKYAFDLFSWAPGYTDQAIIRIQNNTKDSVNWKINIENIKNVNDSVLHAIDIYIKEFPNSSDILKSYDSVITDGYKYIGNLYEANNSEIVSEILENNESIELSILLHVREDSSIEQQNINFRNILKVIAESSTLTTEKIFE